MATPETAFTPEFDAGLVTIVRASGLEFCDFPTGWAIQHLGADHGLAHDPRCSAEDGRGPFLCDCDAMLDAWRRGMDLAGLARRY